MAENQESTSTPIETQIQAAIAEAHKICDQLGSDSKQCSIAWEAVEELQAEASDQQQGESTQTAFETYCEDNPAAVECRIYED